MEVFGVSALKLVLMSLLEVFVFLFVIIEATADQSLRDVLLYHGANGLVVVYLLLPLHRLFHAAKFMFDSMLECSKL